MDTEKNYTKKPRLPPTKKSDKKPMLHPNKIINKIFENVKSTIDKLKKKKSIQYNTDTDIKNLEKYKKQLLVKLEHQTDKKSKTSIINYINNIDETLKQRKLSNFGDFSLPIRGMVNAFTDGRPRGAHYLLYPSATHQIKNVSNINSRMIKVPVNFHSFGSVGWYPAIDIDKTYSNYSGGYGYPNGGMGPYSAVGLGNYPSKMFAEVNRLYRPQTKK